MGEATNPGPDIYPQIGCINPTGLLGKAQLLSTLPRQSLGTIWAVSETHLTRPGKSKLGKELAFHKADFRMEMGAPVPPKSTTISAVGGRHRGVGFLCNSSSSRPLTPTWSDEDWDQNRVHAAAFLIANRWILGGVVYGHAAQPDTLETKNKTSAQVDLLIDRLVYQSEGLRFLAGDFNQPDDGIPAFQLLRDKGWVSIQRWAEQKFGQTPQPTCKGVTCKDHVFVSPELAVYLKSVTVDDTWFKDHAILYANFESIGAPPKVPLWKTPKSIDPIAIPEKAVDLNNTHESLAQEYEAIANDYEDRVSQALILNHKQPLSTAQRGRATVKEVRLVQEFSAPPKIGRQGELQPLFHGSDLYHSRLLRQCRRLINITRLGKVETKDDAKAQHKDKLWQSILKAPGFPPKFRTWWKDQQVRQLPFLPNLPPTSVEAVIISRYLESTLRDHEKQLMKTRVAYAKQRRLDDPNVIFRDLKADGPQPLQALVDKNESIIQEVDKSDYSIVVSPPKSWMQKQALVARGKLYEIIHAEPDKLWLDQIEGLEEGLKVTQESLIGDVFDLFNRFGQEWKSRWDRHLHTPDSFWDPIIDFAKHAIPQQPVMQYQPITFEMWTKELRKKRKHAAVGPDGFSKSDLLNLPKDLTMRLLQILELVEQGHDWPVQMLVGFVVALEKVPGAQKVGQYRPITIFALSYRTWGSIRAKQILQHLCDQAPVECTGNLPGRSAMQIWHGVQTEIEMAQHTGKPLSGTVIDLVKAFNLLPRVPILTLMQHFGVPSQIVVAWGKALTLMQRRFRLRNCIGPAIRSSTGFAEGDAMSVTAMLVTNLVCHKWMTLKHPSTTLWTYVDNIECTAPDASTTIDALKSLADFTKAMDVLIDDSKTYVWSVAASERATFRDQQMVIKHSARDLGGHMQYTGKVTNFTVVDKCKQLDPLWNRLNRSLSKGYLKVRAVKAKAWPHCLHGVSLTHIGDEIFDKLRTGCMKGLSLQSMGASPLAHMSLVETPDLDPQFYAIWKTLVDLRSQAQHDQAAFVWQCLKHDPRLQAPPGPYSVALNRVRQIGWEWERESVFTEHSGVEFDILQCSIQELRIRAVQGWQDRTKAILAHRKTMKGIVHTSPWLTMQGVQKLPIDKAALLKVSLNGTFFTSEHDLKQQKGGDGLCVYCKCPDSQIHRHWECKFFDSCRKDLTPEQIETIRTLDPAITAHGWIPEPPSLRCFQAAVAKIPNATSSNVWPPDIPELLQCFTDGGCLSPQNPMLRLAYWGVVISSRDYQTFLPVANGLVPGVVQTALRGEIIAATKACELAISLGKPIVLWVDNALVFKRVRAYQSKHHRFPPNQKDRDLWENLHDTVRLVGTQLQSVMKIYSHQNSQGALDDFETWAFQGNAAADRTAESALQQFPELITLWSKAKQDIAMMLQLKQAIHKIIIDIGHQAVRSRPTKKHPELTQRVPRITREAIVEVTFNFAMPEVCPLRYRIPRLSEFLDWLRSLEDMRAEPRLISWFEFNILSEEDFSQVGFRYSKHNKRWALPESSAMHADFVRRSNYLASFLSGFCHMMGGKFKVLHIRPSTDVLAFWTQCVSVRWSDSSIGRAEALLREHQPTFHSVRDLRSLR